jgi:hypothetical protein
MRAALLLLLAACDPVWGVDVRVEHPGRQPVENATLAVACDEGANVPSWTMMRTTPDGKAHVGGLGSSFPVGCDIYIAKPGFATQRIRYRDLCPEGPDRCDRVFSFDLVLEPAPQ